MTHVISLAKMDFLRSKRKWTFGVCFVILFWFSPHDLPAKVLRWSLCDILRSYICIQDLDGASCEFEGFLSLNISYRKSGEKKSSNHEFYKTSRLLPRRNAPICRHIPACEFSARELSILSAWRIALDKHHKHDLERCCEFFSHAWSTCVEDWILFHRNISAFPHLIHVRSSCDFLSSRAWWRWRDTLCSEFALETLLRCACPYASINCLKVLLEKSKKCYIKLETCWIIIKLHLRKAPNPHKSQKTETNKICYWQFLDKKRCTSLHRLTL